jgi:hypothetical protein
MNHTSTIPVRLETIQYGDRSITVAVNTKDAKQFFITRSSAESMLNGGSNDFPEEIAARLLKNLDVGLIAGEFSGSVVNKEGAETRNVSLLLFEDFVKVVAWEAKNRNDRAFQLHQNERSFECSKNDRAFQLLVAGFADSFRSRAYEQMGIPISGNEWIETIAKYLKGYHKLFGWVRSRRVTITGW